MFEGVFSVVELDILYDKDTYYYADIIVKLAKNRGN